ncbi:MAG: hypothetical protein AAGE98_09390 [Actinomycetota bacterium]
MLRSRPLLTGLAVALVAAACGGGSGEPLIQARPPTTTTTTTPDSAEDVERETVAIDGLVVGMCSDTEDIDVSGGLLTLTDCTEPHRYEVLALVPAGGITRADGTMTADAQETCEELFLLQTGVAASESLIEVIAFETSTTAGTTCVIEAPDQRTDFFARAEIDLPSVQVNRTQLDGPSTNTFAITADVASDGDSIIVLGRTDRTDPGGIDAIVWRSVNGGASFSAVSDTALRGAGTGEVPESVVTVDGGYVAIGTRYDAAPDPQPWAVVTTGGGATWTQLAVPLAGNAGAELRAAITRADGTIEIVGSLYDRRGLRRPAIWTWGGLALSQPEPLVDEEAEPDANYFVESAFVDENGVTVQVTNLFANQRSAFFSATAGEWVAFSDVPALQMTTAAVADATFAIRGGALNQREPDGRAWERVELPGHDGAQPVPVAVTTDGVGVLAIGTMASVQGTTAAFWFRPPGGDFELIYFDVDQAVRADAPTAAAPVDSGFLVVGIEDPERDGAAAPVAWVVGSP